MAPDLLFTWVMVFFRSLGIVILIPQMAGHSPPVTVRIGLGMCLATLLTGIVPPAHFPASGWGLISATAGEVGLGLAMGFIGQLGFQAVELAGRIASSEIGLSGAPGLNTPQISSEPLAGFLSAFGVIIFFLFGGHLMILSAFARSFHFAHPGEPVFNPNSTTIMIEATGRVIELGLRMSAPFIALNFLVTLAFSVLGRAVPRIGVFVLSAPVRGMAGMALFAGGGGLIARYLYAEFTDLPAKLLLLVAH
jgi:flagellar biosynthetic protein FliR